MGSWMNFKTRLTMLRPAVVLGLAAAILMSVVVVNALTASDLGGGQESIDVAVNTWADDADVTIARLGLFKVSTTTAAAGTSAPGIEATNALPAVNNALTANNWAYRFTVSEANATAWQASEDFRFDVYGELAGTTSLLTTLYCQQAVIDDGNTDGVTATVDLGSATVIHDTFDIIVRRQSAGW